MTIFKAMAIGGQIGDAGCAIDGGLTGSEAGAWWHAMLSDRRFQEMAVSEDIIIALVMLGLGAATIVVGAILAIRQKTYLDPKTRAVTNVIDIPWLGSIKTNIPAGALCFIGLGFGYFAYSITEQRAPTFINLRGTVELDKVPEDGAAVIVGITSGSWIALETPRTQQFPVEIRVPNSWPSYNVYAMSPGIRPEMHGTSKDAEFKLHLKSAN